MYKVKILGAGSIGNHLAHASRQLGWQVAICDIDRAALERTRHEIYPGRYGAWDDAIELYPSDEAPRSVYDLIVIGTPPDAHIPLALQALEEGPRAVLVEKPLCGPNLEGAEELRQRSRDRGIAVFVGYDHAVGRAAEEAIQRASRLARVDTLDVEFREYWGGIFAAHPWLDGPGDSYLGFKERGGGASGEHSHAINLWQHFAHELGFGRVAEVSAELDLVREGGLDYDRLCLLHLRTESGLLGRVVQDVVTEPARKWARAQGSDGFVEIGIGAKPGVDIVDWKIGDEAAGSLEIEKTRPDDFIKELRHLEAVLEGRDPSRAILLERGLETMLVVSAAHLSSREGRRVRIDYEAPCTIDALQVA